MASPRLIARYVFLVVPGLARPLCTPAWRLPAQMTPTELEEFQLREAEQADKNRPSWVCWSNADTATRISLDELRKQFMSQAANQEVIEVEED